jgi:cell division protein FtsL
MTIIQPGNKKTFWDRILAGLIIASVLISFFLVSAYTRFINLNHGLAETRKAIQEVQTANAELKDKIFALFDRSRLESLAAERNLVVEKNPQYLRVAGEPVALSH